MLTIPPYPPCRRLASTAGALVLCAGLPCARAQDATGASTTFRPTLAAQSGYVETRGRIDGGNGREGFVEVSPGLTYSSRAGRVQGTLDYSLNMIERRGIAETAGSEFQNALNAAFRGEVIPNWGYIDTRASLSKEPLSPFGQQTAPDSPQANDNRSTVASASIRPYVQGRLGSIAEYVVSLQAQQTRSKAIAGIDSKSGSGSITLRSQRSAALLGWSLEASDEHTQYAGEEPSANKVARATLNVTPNPELQLSLIGGRESIAQDQTVDPRYTNLLGLRLTWTPSPRTTFSAEGEHRYFGTSGRVGFAFRSAHTVWNYSLVRDATHSADAQALTQPVTLYQLLFDQQASALPDPAARDQAVRDEIARLGLSPDQAVQFGFLTSTLSVQQVQTLSMAWVGQRLTLNAQLYSNNTSQLILSSISDPTLGEPVRQRGYSSSLGYLLTPRTTISFTGSRAMTFGTSTEAGNDLKSAELALTTRLTRLLSGQISARYSVFNSTSSPYRETSVAGSLNLRY